MQAKFAKSVLVRLKDHMLPVKKIKNAVFSLLIKGLLK